MTRTEFDARFAATEQNTEGYSASALAEINDAVFARVAGLDLDDESLSDEVKNGFAREMNAR